MIRITAIFISSFLILITLHSCNDFSPVIFEEAESNAELVNEGFNRCIKYVNAWSSQADHITGLIPRNLRESRDYWNAWDAAADNYPFMVITSSILMPEYFKGTAIKMLETERKVTSRLGSLPDTYSFSKRGFLNETIDTARIIFGSAEYMKDGLIPITEWLGLSPWSDRMFEILNDFSTITRVVKELKGKSFGPNVVMEANGDLLQVLSRTYWLTGKREYLEWATEIADYYLNDNNLPTTGSDHLRIRDHGCEIISGLCEAYLAAYYSWPEKRQQWKKYIHMMLDRILETGRNEDDLFYNEINPLTGEIISKGIADNFGYTLNAYYFVSELDSVPEYKEAVIKALSILFSKYRNFDWENGGCDGYADAIEGALNLYNRIPIETTKMWLDSEIKVMWNYQKPDGIIEGWHGDGNFARTTIMYCLWKTMGLLPDTWDENLKLGAIHKDGVLRVFLYCHNGWKGKIIFETSRFKDKMHMPIDYPRINQFQQWFTPEKEKKYQIRFFPSGKKQTYTGQMLLDGIMVKISPGEKLYFEVKAK